MSSTFIFTSSLLGVLLLQLYPGSLEHVLKVLVHIIYFLLLWLTDAIYFSYHGMWRMLQIFSLSEVYNWNFHIPCILDGNPVIHCPNLA